MRHRLHTQFILLIALGALLALGSALSPAVEAVVVPPPESPIFIQTNGPTAPMSLGDWYTSRDNGVGPGYHYFGIFVPCAWPAGLDFHIDLYSPEINSGVPAFDEPGSTPIDATIFELYRPGTEVVAPNQPGPGAAGSVISASFPPSNLAENRWVRFYTLQSPVTCGQYILRAETGGNDQNSWRLRFGADNDSDPGNDPPPNYDNPDGIIGSGDEAVIGITQTTYQHFAAGERCLTLYQFVADGLDFVRFHNFDMDLNVRVRYYPPGAVYDPTGSNNEGLPGTVSGYTLWNNGTATERGPGDQFADPEPGWWRLVSCVLGDNQFNQEGQVGVPTFYRPMPEPDMLISKDNGRTEVLPGAVVTYTIAFTNTALTTRPNPGAALNVEITDTLPPEVDFLSCGFAEPPTLSGTCDHNAGEVIFRLDQPLIAGAGGAVTVTVQVTPDALGPLRNQVRIDYRDLINNQYPPVQAEDIDQVLNLPYLISTKSDRLLLDADLDGLADPFDLIEYTITLTNLGRVAAAPVTISDSPDPLTRLIAGTVQVSPTTAIVIRGNNPGDSDVLVSLDQLAPGAEASVVFQVEVRNTIPADATTVVNQAWAETPGLPPVPSDDPDLPGGPGDGTETPVDPPQGGPPTAIELLSFLARPMAGGVELTWITGAELETAGFHLYRGINAERAGAVRLNERLIRATGTPVAGAYYRWFDKTTPSGVVYSYWLVEQEYDGATNEYGPFYMTRPAVRDLRIVHLPLLLVR